MGFSGLSGIGFRVIKGGHEVGFDFAHVALIYPETLFQLGRKALASKGLGFTTNHGVRAFKGFEVWG